MAASRFVVGIDLGTTNCALAYVDTGKSGDLRCETLAIPQVVNPGAIEPRNLLPSFLYLPGLSEQPAGSLKLPWDAIESVRFGALVDRRKRAAILKALKARELHHIKAIQMHLSVDRFALEEEVLQR